MDPVDQLTIDVRGAGLIVAGELDALTAPLMYGALEAFLGRTVEIDMAGVTFMDSSGIACLLRAAHTGITIVITDPSNPVRRILELTGLVNEFGIV